MKLRYTFDRKEKSNKIGLLCIPILLFLFSFLLMFSCNDSELGIFYGLKSEERIGIGSLPTNITVGSMAKAGNDLYIAAGSVWRKPFGDENWHMLPTPGGFHLSTSLASDNDGNIFAIYYNKDNANTGFFSLNGLEWTQLPRPDAWSIQSVKSTADGKIFVSTRNTSPYTTDNDGRLYHYTGGTFTLIDLPERVLFGRTYTSLIGSSFDVIFAADGKYWISNAHSIFYSDDLDEQFTLVEPIDRNRKIEGLAYHDGHIYFTFNGRDRRGGRLGVISSSDGSGFRSEHPITPSNTFLTNLAFFQVSNDNWVLLVGTEAVIGYFQLPNPTPDNIHLLDRPRGQGLPLVTNYNSAVDLHRALVLDFFIDPSVLFGGDLYALTNRGLWKSSGNFGERRWSRE
ncbi:MAG: hypothetical protein FWD87_02570 [Spirochaetaceae bacterium]|nr:hypothetical protein [Spirochaetaceae bacterium]